MSEKLTGADHTKLDDQFTQMEKITDVFLEVEVRNNSSLSVVAFVWQLSTFIVTKTKFPPSEMRSQLAIYPL